MSEILTLRWADLSEAVQRQIDDASEDFHYVKPDGGRSADRLNDAVGCHLSEGPADCSRRVEALSFATVQRARIYRANGGVGRVMVKIGPGKAPDTIEMHLVNLCSAAELFDYVRNLNHV